MLLHFVPVRDRGTALPPRRPAVPNACAVLVSDFAADAFFCGAQLYVLAEYFDAELAITEHMLREIIFVGRYEVMILCLKGTSG